MSGDGVLEVINQLLQNWLASGGSASRAVQLRDLRLDPAGAHVLARIDHPQATGELVFRIEVRAVAPGRFSLRLRPERIPERLGPLLEPLRDMLETAQATLDLRFDAQPHLEEDGGGDGGGGDGDGDPGSTA